MGAVAKLREEAPPKLKPFLVEVRTEAGQFARYHAISTDAFSVLMSALDVWGISNIHISPQVV